MKKTMAILLVLCAVTLLLAACGSDPEPAREPISTADAVRVVLTDLDMEITEAQPHVHTGDFNGNEVYYVYVTVEEKNMSYAIDMYSGEILNIAESNHSH
jgi:uncharacterized secreted protein with C-terminal beta-propeller domain